MKRTSTITLALLGALALTGCSEEKKEPTTYKSVAECTADGISAAECQKSFDEATKAAPKFATQDQCAAQFGNCQVQTNADGTSWFMPALMGYMVGSMMSNGSRSYAQPVYIDRDRRPVTGGYSGGVYRTTPAAPSYTSRQAARASAARASTSSRGGFGGSSSSSYGG